jgi:twinkle protein
MQELENQGIHLYRSTVGDHKTYCPQCRETRKSKNKLDKPLSVTIQPDSSAVWMCHNCGFSGGTRTAQQGAFRPRDMPTYRQEPKRPPEPELKPVSDGVMRWFEKRGISQSTVEAFGVYKAQKSFGAGAEASIAFPYRVDGELVNVKYRTQDKRFRQENGAERTLFNIDAVKDHWEQTGRKELVFVEGEMDVIAMWEAGIKNAVTLPDGAPKQAKFDTHDKRFEALNNCEWIQEAEKVVVATDADEAGRALALELTHRFGKDRCWRVSWGDSSAKDANEYLLAHGAEALVKIIESAEAYPIEGLHQVNDYRAEVFNIYEGHVEKPLDTGWSSLDEIYKVMPATFHVVTGVPNHGKSNFLDQLTVQLAKIHNWKFAVFSPEHSTPQHLRRLSEKVVSMPFDHGPSARMNKEILTQCLDFLNDHYYFIESQDDIPTIDWLLEKARIACLRFGVQGIVVDPYNEINANRENGKREDEHIRDLISKCKQFCRKHDVVIWMVAHPAKMQRTPDGVIPPPTLYDISGAAHWNNMADVGLVVHRDFENNTTRVITRKIREQGLYGHIGEAHFRYDVTKQSYVESLPEPTQRKGIASYYQPPSY